MTMYLDSAYIAKFYVNEPDAAAVRKLIRGAAKAQGRAMMDVFRGHVERDVWNLIPVSNALLRRAVALIRTLPKNAPLRAGDAIHLATALDVSETEIWTNDRHLLAAAAHFGIAGRSV